MMKVTCWEAVDIIGHICVKLECNEKQRVGYLSRTNSKLRYVLISLSDGSVLVPYLKELLLAGELTQFGYLPEKML